MIYITGDTHGQFGRIFDFCDNNKTTVNDIIIILGDVGLNYRGDSQDAFVKKKLSELPITLFCIHGNHENRVQNISSYSEQEWSGSKVYIENDYPNLIFAKDGEIYSFDNKQCIVIGGAYSIDKFYRLSKGYNWWTDEQPSDEIKAYVEQRLKRINNKIDVILSHTCPFKYIPREVFLPMVDQSTVDSSTEIWLDKIDDEVEYNKWYCGHYHTEKCIDKMEFLFESIIEFK